MDPAAEMPVHDHGEGHDHTNCKFCQAQQEAAASATALVKVVDPQGQTVPIHARKLLALSEGQIVVIRGTASIDGLGHLVVAADGVYPRR
jgi:hypothetical protein